MAEDGNPVGERRSQTLDLVDKLLAERKELLGLLFDSSSADPRASIIDGERLQEFCDVLVDYIAAGHFGLYQRLSEGTERRSSVLAVAERVYPQIKSITDTAVVFSDRCEASGYQSDDGLVQALSDLAENLSTRFELEDQIIEEMLK